MSKRIVLVDPSGDVLFSGESLAAVPDADNDTDALPSTKPKPTPSEVRDVYEAAADDDEEPCPPTLRSLAESGTFPIAKGPRDERAA